ncbi:hypothetical protein EV121DRAFT_297986 [Schizophyllum commune]
MGRAGEGDAPPAFAEHVPREIGFRPRPKPSLAFDHHHPHRAALPYDRHGQLASSLTRAGHCLVALNSAQPPPPPPLPPLRHAFTTCARKQERHAPAPTTLKATTCPSPYPPSLYPSPPRVRVRLLLARSHGCHDDHVSAVRQRAFGRRRHAYSSYVASICVRALLRTPGHAHRCAAA